MSRSSHTPIFFIIAITQYWFLQYCSLNHDVAGVLHFSYRMLYQHEVLYRDIFDVNPPLIFYLSMPAVWLSNTFSFNLSMGWMIEIILFLTTSLYLSAYYLKDKFSSLFWLTIILCFGSVGMIGQREHLMVILCLPYCIGKSFPKMQASKSRRVLQCCLYMMGLLIKPNFLIMGALVELYCLVEWKKYWQSFEWLLIIGLGLLYGVLVFFSGYIEVLPWVMGPYEELVHKTIIDILLDPSTIIPFLINILLSIDFLKLPRASKVFLLLSFGGLLSSALQGKGWPYHDIPYADFSMMAFVFYIESSKVFLGKSIAIPLIVIASFYSLQEKTSWFPRETDSPIVAMENFLNKQKANSSIFVISPELSPVFPALAEHDTLITDKTPAMTAWQLQQGFVCRKGEVETREDIGAYNWFKGKTLDALKSGVDILTVDPIPMKANCRETFKDWIFKDKDLMKYTGKFHQVGKLWRFEIWTSQADIKKSTIPVKQKK